MSYQWIIDDLSKQAQEIMFSRKKNEVIPPKCVFQQYSGWFNFSIQESWCVILLLLDDKLSYKHHFKFVLNKVKKTIGFLYKFQQSLPRHFLIAIYKSFVQLYLDYGDIVYGRAFKEYFHKNLESIKYNAAIATTTAIRVHLLRRFFKN